MVLKLKDSKLKDSKLKDEKPKDLKAKASKLKIDKLKADKSKASESPEVEVLSAAKSSDAEQAMHAPSLENTIITKARDLSRLSREDLLQLLLTQSKDAERLQDYLREVADEFERCTSLNARLREKLDTKDEKIERLKGRLDDKDKRIASMQARLDELEVLKKEEERRSRIIVSAAEGVRGALEAFNVTTDWYIGSLRGLCGDSGVKPAHAASQVPQEASRVSQASLHAAPQEVPQASPVSQASLHAAPQEVPQASLMSPHATPQASHESPQASQASPQTPQTSPQTSQAFPQASPAVNSKAANSKAANSKAADE